MHFRHRLGIFDQFSSFCLLRAFTRSKIRVDKKLSLSFSYRRAESFGEISTCVSICVCMCAPARVRVCVCMCVCVFVCHNLCSYYFS